MGSNPKLVTFLKTKFVLFVYYHFIVLYSQGQFSVIKNVTYNTCMFSYFYDIYDMFEYIGIKLEPVYKGHLSITVTFVRSLEWPL